MTCREVIDFLADYLSAELPAAQRVAFDEHIAGCEACVAYIKSYEQAVELGKTAFEQPDGEVSEEVPDELIEAILAARKRKT